MNSISMGFNLVFKCLLLFQRIYLRGNAMEKSKNKIQKVTLHHKNLFGFGLCHRNGRFFFLLLLYSNDLPNQQLCEYFDEWRIVVIVVCWRCKQIKSYLYTCTYCILFSVNCASEATKWFRIRDICMRTYAL